MPSSDNPRYDADNKGGQVTRRLVNRRGRGRGSARARVAAILVTGGRTFPRPRPCATIESRKGRACVSDGERRTLFTTAEAAAMLGIAHGTVKNAIKRGVLAHEAIHPRLNMVTLEAIETYRRERLGQRGGYRPGAGRRPMPEPEATAGEEQQDAE